LRFRSGCADTAENQPVRKDAQKRRKYIEVKNGCQAGNQEVTVNCGDAIDQAD
jgi:hypothetical protein